MKTILLIAGLLGACDFAAGDFPSDSFLRLRTENYFRNPLAFPEPGIDIIAVPPPEEQAEKVVAPEPRTELMRGATWEALAPGVTHDDDGNGGGLWWLLVSTVAALIAGAFLAAAGALQTPRPARRRGKTRTTLRMMSSC